MCDRRVRMLCVFVGILSSILFASGRANAQTTLDSITVSSAFVDVSGGLAQDTVRTHLTNPTAPIAYILVYLGNPDLGEDVAGTTGELVAGSAKNGSWESILLLFADTPPGTYPVYVVAIDSSFNSELLPTGKTVQIVGGDAQAPVLGGAASIVPAAVDVSDSERTIVAQAPLLDNASGVASAFFMLKNAADETIVGESGALVSGDGLNGTWQASILVPRNVLGTLTLAIDAEDAATNVATLATGVTLQVSGGDTAAPVITTAPAVAPDTVNIASSDKEVTITIGVTDDRSGIASVSMYLSDSAGTATYSGSILQTSGDSMSGVWSSTILIPLAAPSGPYDLTVTTTDVAGNYRDAVIPRVLTVVRAPESKTRFSVDLRSLVREGLSTSHPVVEIAGGINAGTYDLHDPDGDTVWTGSVALPVGQTVHYAFGFWLGGTLIDELHGPADGRSHAVVSTDSVDLPVVLFDDAAPAAVNQASAALVAWPFIQGGEQSISFNADSIETFVALAVQPPALNAAVAVRRYASAPGGAPPPGIVAIAPSLYWRIASVPTAAGLVTQASFEYAFFGGVSDPTALRILRRSGSGQPWTAMPAELNLDEKTLTVGGVPAAGEWTLATVSGANTLVPQAPSAVTNPSPLNGQPLVERSKELSWNPSASARLYDLYLWRTADTVPTAPTAAHLTEPTYQPALLLPGTAYSWRVVAKNIAGATSSPVWSFTTIDVPDLAVDSVEVGANAFSDRPIDVRWVVKNVGASPTGTAPWSDKLFLSADTIWDRADIALGTFDHVSHLGPGERYSNIQTVTLPGGVFGPYHILVYANWTNGVTETNTANNQRTRPIDITLTPPPDLQVPSVVAPDLAFSGQSIDIQYTVKNFGLNATTSSQWFDGIYLVVDTSFDIVHATYLGGVWRTKGLLPDSSYHVTVPVRLPDTISGLHYLLVATDVKNHVPEYTLESNNTRIDSINIVLSPPPDLVVENITGAASAASGSTMPVQWSVRNQGAGPTVYPNWRDRVFLSRTPAFNPDSALFVGSVPHGSLLPVDSADASATDVLVPDGISGSYYVYVETDYEHAIYESAFEGNNISRSAAPVVIKLSPWPDLTVAEISASAASTAGDKVPITYRVKNIGVAAAPAREWADSVFISQSPVWDRAVATPVGVARGTGPLPAGSEYERTTICVLPPSLPTHAVYYYVWTDAANAVFEYADSGNNIARSAPVAVTAYPPVDLAVTELSVPASGSSGQPAAVHYRVQNIGGGATLATEWTDRLYLSQDTVLQTYADILLLRIPRIGALPAGASYARDLQVTLPNGISGAYHFIVAADSGNRTADSALVNNVAVSSPATAVSLSASPDLQLSALSGPSAGLSGEPVTIAWHVQNAGVGIAPEASWYDAVVLSKNTVVDGSDIALGGVQHAGPLAAGGSYDDSITVSLPPAISGSYYLIAVTDKRNEVYEHNAESNNTALQPIALTLSPQVDLVVDAVSIPESAAVNDDVTIGWTVRNQSTNTASGWLTEAVYFSTDSLWDIGDLVLGQTTRSVSIAPGATAPGVLKANLSSAYLSDSSGTITDETPGLSPGKYYVIVRTNIRNYIRETDLSNNARASGGLVNVDVAFLQIGAPSAGTIDAARPRYYRVIVPANLDLRFTATNNVAYPSIDLFSSFGKVPTGADYDYRTIDPLALSRQMFVPSTRAGTYYLMLRSQFPPSSHVTETYSVIAETLGFSVTSVTPTRGGSGGHVTGTIRGAGFRPESRVFLASDTGTVTEAEVLERTSSVEMRIRWDLAGVPLGSYRVRVENGGASAELSGGFAVEPLREEAITIDHNAPRALLVNRKEQYAFQFTNTSNVDLDYVFVRIFAPSGTEIAVQTSSPDLRTRSMLIPRELLPDSVVVKDYVDSGTEVLVPLVCRNLPPGEARMCALTVRNTAFAGGSQFPLAVRARSMNKAFFLQEQLAHIEELRLRVLQNPNGNSGELLDRASDPVAFSGYLLGDFVTLGLLDSAEVGAASLGSAAMVGRAEGLLAETVRQRSLLKGHGSRQIDDLCPDVLGLGCPAAILDCFIELPIHVLLSGALCIFGVSTSCGNADFGDFNVIGCLGIASGIVCLANEFLCRGVVFSFDPNDLIGPPGAGDDRWVALKQTLPYTVRFENDSTRARAPAQTVTVTQQFDTTADIRSFRLGRFGFGRYAVDVPGNTAAYAGRIDARDSLGIYVDVVAGVDVPGRKAFWTFTSVDPATGEKPYDPLSGLLPVNDSAGRGAGFVSYTIRPNPLSRTRDTIRAKARIVFDANDPIDTPPVFNTIDAVAPQSAVQPLLPQFSARKFPLVWHGSDDALGSGAYTYTIYSSKNGGPYVAWLTNVTDTTAWFTGEDSSQYRFFSIATDVAGNAEPFKLVPDATTSILLGVEGADADLPKEYALSQNYPNPFNPSTVIRYAVPRESHVTLKIFTVLGQEVATLVAEDRPAGFGTVEWKADGLASGVYFYRLDALSVSQPVSRFTQVRKLVIMK